MCQTSEKPSHTQPRIEFTSALETRQGFIKVSKIVQFHNTQFEMGLRIGRHLDHFQLSEFPVELVFPYSRFRISRQAEVMDQEGCMPQAQPQALNSRTNGFVHAANK